MSTMWSSPFSSLAVTIYEGKEIVLGLFQTFINGVSLQAIIFFGIDLFFCERLLWCIADLVFKTLV